MFQRQLSKEGLSNVVNQSGKSAQSDMSTEDLADLFTPDYDCLSSTYEGMLEAAAGGEGAEELSEERLRAAVHRAQVPFTSMYPPVLSNVAPAVAGTCSIMISVCTASLSIEFPHRKPCV